MSFQWINGLNGKCYPFFLFFIHTFAKKLTRNNTLLIYIIKFSTKVNTGFSVPTKKSNLTTNSYFNFGSVWALSIYWSSFVIMKNYFWNRQHFLCSTNFYGCNEIGFSFILCQFYRIFLFFYSCILFELMNVFKAQWNFYTSKITISYITFIGNHFFFGAIL